jgi:hypothetical protein
MELPGSDPWNAYTPAAPTARNRILPDKETELLAVQITKRRKANTAEIPISREVGRGCSVHRVNLSPQRTLEVVTKFPPCPRTY